jgi:hypothetical protein
MRKTKNERGSECRMTERQNMIESLKLPMAFFPDEIRLIVQSDRRIYLIFAFLT